MVRLPYRYIARRLSEGDTAAADEKGAALEDVVARTFCKIPGVGFIWRNKTNCDGSEEIDILLYNGRDRLGLPFLPDYLLFECKNWAEPVDSGAVAAFVEKIRARHQKVGILVAASGVTGDRDRRTAANDIIRRAFDGRDNITLLVITRAELQGLRTVEDLVTMMQKKFGELMGRGFVLISDSSKPMRGARQRS